MTVAEAYLVCQDIARREAKNFFYAFRVLPRAKRNAMCAVYAFMRRADDIADDEALTVDQRRTQMEEWKNSWRAGASEDPVFIAVRDAQTRFGIADDLLGKLVEGTAMDLEPHGTGMHTYKDFAELYTYCYLVASVVGLVCIRIFGYKDLRAEKLAEETGVAFQLTNILRDVKEDANRGRVYLPLDLLEQFNVSVDRVSQLAAGSILQQMDRAMLASFAARAEEYYCSSAELLPLIDADSRAALWVLVTIYHDLLKRIVNQDYDVFSQRVSVPTGRKLLILAQGAAQSVANRLGA